MSKDLKNLLKLSVEAQTSNSDSSRNEASSSNSTALVAHPTATDGTMSEDRRQWLNEALSHFAVDSRQREMAECLKILETATSSSSSRMNALEALADLVDDLDMANDFAKMGGFNSIRKCLSIPQEAKEACVVIGELAQNNPKCQEQMTAIFLQPLVNLLDSKLNNENDDNSEHGSDKGVALKAMFALSCLSRSNEKAQEELMKNDNLAVLVKAVQCPDNKRLTARVAFFISALCQENEAIASRLTQVGLVAQLIAQLSAQERVSGDDEGSSVVHEHLAKALFALVKSNQDALKECRQDGFGLKRLLQDRLKEFSSNEEHQDELEMYVKLQDLCFK